MKWIKGNHPKKTQFTGAVGSKQAFVRRQWGKNPPTYALDSWMGDRWLHGDSGANMITHYMWIEEPK